MLQSQVSHASILALSRAFIASRCSVPFSIDELTKLTGSKYEAVVTIDLGSQSFTGIGEASDSNLEKAAQTACYRAVNRAVKHWRRARATNMNRNNVPLNDIQAQLGHTQLATTYLYIKDDEEKRVHTVEQAGWLHVPPPEQMRSAENGRFTSAEPQIYQRRAG